MRKRNNGISKGKKGIIMVICLLAAIYLGMAAYFKDHFYFGSTINSISVVGKTVEEANSEIESSIAKYSLQLEGRGDVEDKIDGSEIDLKYNPQGKIEELKKNQHPLSWIKSLFSKNDNVLNDIVTFDEELLKSKVQNLAFTNNKDTIKPENPKFEYGQGTYDIVDEVKGNVVDTELLYNNIYEAIIEGKTDLNIDEVNCYNNPKYTANSQETTDAKNLLNSYVGATITYDFGDRSETVDGDKINEWLYVDDDMNVQFNNDKVRRYVELLAMKYNTYETSRKFKTTAGNTITVNGGNYGWIIDKPEETKQLIEAVKEGKDSKREPVYSQTAVSRNKDDVGNTYLEVNLSKQHIWFYKNGSLVVDGDVVTGNASLNFSTPTGTYRLNYKAKDATLKGENYTSKVTFWMPFNNNIGLHDASWRNSSEFGGTTYLTNGSHGCVNAPYGLAEKVYQNIEAGTPVICY